MSDNEFFGGRRRRRGNGGDAFSPYTLFASGEQGVWYDPSDLTPEKVSWRRNLLTYSQDFENAAWTKSNASILSNLALYSQDFDNASWTARSNVTITANSSVAPDGTTTAETSTENAVSASHVSAGRTNTFTANAFTLSVYAKQSVGTRNVGVRMWDGTTSYGYVFNISSGTTVGNTTGDTTPSGFSITAVGNGWYRLTITQTMLAGAGDYSIVMCNGQTFNYAGDNTSAVLLWGAQLVPGSTAQTYTRSLATAAPIQFADPLGGTLADKLVVNTATSTHQISQTLTIRSGVSYAFSAYVKAAEYGWAIVYAGTIGVGKYINLTTGAVGSDFIAAPTSTTVVDAGNGWWRVEMIAQSGANTSADIRVYAATANGTSSYTGDGVSGIYVYGAQVEQASTASAYQRITDFSSDFLAAFPTHALYQESTGVTPVTTLGQSVGLVLDKRLGALTAVQPISITNSTFTSGSTGWSSTNATLNTTVSGQIDVTSTSGAAFGVLEQAIVAPAGALIRVEVDCEIVSGTGFIGLWTGTTGLSTTFSDTGRRTRLFYAPVAVTNGSAVRFGGTATIGNTLRAYSVRASIVPGNHALQATSAARPTLQARSNLFTYSEQFDNAAWVKTNTTVTANNSVAPDGTTTADTLASTGPSVTNYINSSAIAVAASTAYTASMFIKAGTSPATQLRFFDNTVTNTIARAVINWSAGVPSFGLTLGWSSTPALFDAGNGWYRFTGTFSSGVYTSIVALYYADNNAVGANTLLWGAQLELGSTATTYQRVVTATDYADVGLPRNLTFDGVDDSLATAGNVDFATWTVGTRRNLLTVPTMFDDAAWVKGVFTVTANQTAAPDGTTTADLITTGASSGYVLQTNTAANGATRTVTGSVYIKNNTGTGSQTVTINMSDGVVGAIGVSFKLSDGTFTLPTPAASWSSITRTVTDVGNGWYRVVLSGTTTQWTTGWLEIAAGALGGTTFYVWGAQLELGSTATAFQDVGTDKATAFAGVTKLSDAARATLFELGNASNGRISFEAPQSAAPNYGWLSGGTMVVGNIVTTYAAPITNVLTGIGNIGADTSIFRVNGAQVGSDSSDQGTGTYFSNILYVGRRGGTSLPFNGRLFQLVIRGAATDSVTVGNAERWVGQLTGVAL